MEVRVSATGRVIQFYYVLYYCACAVRLEVKWLFWDLFVLENVSENITVKYCIFLYITAYHCPTCIVLKPPAILAIACLMLLNSF